MSNENQNYVQIPNSSQEIINYLEREGIVARLKVILNNIVTNTDQGGVRLYKDDKGALKLGEETLIADTTAENVDEQLEKLKQDIGKLDEDIQSLRLADTEFSQSLSTISESLRQLQEELDGLEISGSGVGKYYPVDAATEEEQLGAIFGDFDTNKALSPNSFAFGEKATAGCRCYYYRDNVSFASDSAVITLQESQERLTEDPESFETGWEVGDTISMVNDAKYWNCATIIAINGNIITVSKLPFTSIADMSGDMGHDDYSIFVLAKPEVGTGDVGRAAHVEGVDNEALGYASHSEGRQNKSHGQNSHSEGRKNKSIGYASHTEGQSNEASGDSAHAEGSSNKATGNMAHAEGRGTTASGAHAHSEGQSTVASGERAHTEGYGSQATAKNAHAEGNNTTASGEHAHSEGDSTYATNRGAHSEGIGTHADGEGAHAEGKSYAEGDYSHAEGLKNYAKGEAQHVQGKYAKIDEAGKYAHIVGNGTAAGSSRSNAHTLDWEGNAWFAGDIYIGGSGQDEGKKLVTLDEVDVVTTVGANGDITIDEFITQLISNNIDFKSNIELLEDITIQLENDLHINFSLNLNGFTLTLQATEESPHGIYCYPNKIENGIIQCNYINGIEMFEMELKSLSILGAPIYCSDSYLERVQNDVYFEIMGSMTIEHSAFSVLYIGSSTKNLQISSSDVSTLAIRGTNPIIAINNHFNLIDCGNEVDLDITNASFAFINNIIDSYEGDNALILQGKQYVQKNYVDELKTTIIYLEDTTYEFDFANNHNKELRFINEVTNISFNFSSGEYADNYSSCIRFNSGATPTSIDYTGSGILNWIGTDCTTVDGLSIFQPSANTHYDIVFDFNGTQFIGLVNGYVPASGNVVSE